jgi:hypothetical protein
MTPASDQDRASSREIFAAMRDVDQVSPGRTTYHSQTTPSGACQTTGLPAEWNGSCAIITGAVHLPVAFSLRAP